MTDDLAPSRACPGSVRTATIEDREAIRAIVLEAFTKPRDGREEVEIVEATWARTAQAERFELVAELAGDVVGHFLAAPGSLAGRPIFGIEPLTVTPMRQGSGIGTRLMTHLLARVDAAGHPLVVHPREPDVLWPARLRTGWPCRHRLPTHRT